MDYVSRDYYDGCMIDRNHRLVEVAGLLLSVYNGVRRSGTGATVNYPYVIRRQCNLGKNMAGNQYRFPSFRAEITDKVQLIKVKSGSVKNMENRGAAKRV